MRKGCPETKAQLGKTVGNTGEEWGRREVDLSLNIQQNGQKSNAHGKVTGLG